MVLELVGADPHHPFDGLQRQRIELAAHAHHQGPIGRQRVGQPQFKAGAFAGATAGVNGATQRLDLIAHHIHADPATGDLRDDRGSRETGQEDQLQCFVRTQLPLRVDQPATARLVEHLFDVDAGTIVADAQQQIAALRLQLESDSGAGALAQCQALRRAFDAMVQRIAQHVFQRCDQPFEHRAVDLDLGVDHPQSDILAQFGGQLAHHLAKSWNQPREGHHLRPRQPFAQFGVQVRLLQQLTTHLLQAAGHGVTQILDVGGALHESTAQLLQL